jgi:glucose-6-phosphate-specific signal transduction histidine kinase
MIKKEKLIMKFMKKYGKEIMFMALFMVIFLATPAYASEYAQKFQNEMLSIIGAVLMVVMFVVAAKCFSKGMTAQAILSILAGVILMGILSRPELIKTVGESFVNKIFS